MSIKNCFKNLLQSWCRSTYGSGITIVLHSTLLFLLDGKTTPTPPNRFSVPDDANNDIDEDLYLFPSYGHSTLLQQTTNPFDFSIRHTDGIIWDATKHQAVFDKTIKFPVNLDPKYRSMLEPNFGDNALVCNQD